MKKIGLIILFLLLVKMVFATGEASTYFNIYVPPNNDAVQRNVSLVVTAIYDSTSFTIVDDDMDGDNDDSVSGILMAGQSYILYIKDNGINDDAKYASGWELKQDGDYFIITSNKLVFASQSTDSDWQHDWAPATNKTSKGERFIIYAPKRSSSNRDLNVFAYEDNTEVTIRQISLSSTLNSGYTHVDIHSRNVVAQKTVNIGEDIIYYYTDGRDLMESGHTYMIESNKPITVQYGALYQNARDGGGYVPGSEGGSSGELFYFSVPYQGSGEQEIRIISTDPANEVELHRFLSGSWVPVSNWALNEREAAEWVGKNEGNATYPTVFRATCTPGKKVMVLEANWMETGSPGTSDMATMATSQNGATSGTNFLAYMAPPGKEQNVTDPFTGTKFDYGSHAYLFASKDTAHVVVKDANTNGNVINRTYSIAPNRYADCNLGLSEWQSIYNGDGNAASGPERPYLIIESDKNISVMLTNFNDNWMTYFGSSLEHGFKQASTSSSGAVGPGDTLNVATTIQNTSQSDIANATIEVLVPDGLTPLYTSITNTSTGGQETGTFQKDNATGTSTGTFGLNTLDAGTSYVVETSVVVDIKYTDGEAVEDNTVFSIETVTSGEVDGVYQSASSAVGVSNDVSNTSNLIFSLSDEAIWAEQTNSWTANWVDYDNDNDLDLFVAQYDVSTPNILYQNVGNGSFVKVTSGDLATKKMSTVAASWADMDNDGDLDVLIANNLYSNSTLCINNGNGNFQVVQDKFQEMEHKYHHGGSWVDVNQDGLLDAFLLDFQPVNFHTLYLNGGGAFELATGSALNMASGRSIGASWADYDNDGFADVFIPNGSIDGSPVSNSLYRGLGNGNFEKTTEGIVVQDGGNSVCSAWGDYNNDGLMDLFVANASNQHNALYKNNGDGTFSKQSTHPFTTDRGNSHGAAWFDYDNDGDLDLIVINNGNQPNYLYRNDGENGFTSIVNDYIVTTHTNPMGVSVADFDKDGDVDVFIPTILNSPNYLYTNKGNSSHWLSIKLIGTSVNRSAIGARVRVKATINGQPTWQMREVSSQNGLGGQNSLNQHFGLGGATIIDSIEVVWQNGKKEYLVGQPVDQEITIVESETATISGLVFIDSNSDCQYGANEEPLANVRVRIGNAEVLTDANGTYRIKMPIGTYSISLVGNGPWNETCQLNSITVESTGITYNDQNIAVVSASAKKDVSVSLGATAWRRGFKSKLNVTIENLGTEDAIGDSLAVQFDQGIIPVSSSIPWTGQANNMYYWKLDTLKKGQVRVIEMTDSISLGAPIGSYKTVSAYLGAENDVDTANNSFEIMEQIVGAIDPNEIEAFPKGIGARNLISVEQEIRYTIRFQNVGNYYAQNVRVENAIPLAFDMNSFKMVSASHAYQVVKEGNTIVWQFDNIHLPDSTGNEPESHGYITYSILPAMHSPSGAQIYNQATISFDFEKPIGTNVAMHTVINASYSEMGQVLVFPNPVDSYTTISLVGGQREGEAWFDKALQKVEIVDMVGKVVAVYDDLNCPLLDLENEGMQYGVYLVKVTNVEGKMYATKMFVK